MCIVIVFNYPLTIYPATEALEGLLLSPPCAGASSEARTRHARLGHVLRLCAVCTTAGLAALVSDFGLVSAVTGGFKGVIAFVLPPLFVMRLHANGGGAGRARRETGQRYRRVGAGAAVNTQVEWVDSVDTIRDSVGVGGGPRGVGMAPPLTMCEWLGCLAVLTIGAAGTIISTTYVVLEGSSVGGE